MPRGPRSRFALARSVVLAALATVVAACDTGDGKTLRPPTEPLPTTTTSAPPAPEFPPDVADSSPPTDPVGTGVFAVLAPWGDGGEIDPSYTCSGEGLAPPVTWRQVPEGTVELAVVAVDLDATAPGGGPFVHWVATGIDPALSSATSGLLPPDAREWPNSFGDTGWGGPCPPAGETHTYVITLHALNQPLAPADDSTTADVVGLVEGSSAGSATINGTSAG
jgi:Raf kinase inhibitor-like YbhB/YbcL family protein